MNATLEGYLDQLVSIRQGVPGIATGLSAEQGGWSPRPGDWSIVQCFDHLNATAREFVPAMDRAMEDARRRGLTGSGPFVYSWLERLVLQFTEPPVRLRMWAPKPLKPRSEKALEEVVQEFLAWQDQLGQRIRQADGLDLARARGRSPAFPLLPWSLGSLFLITLAHERRHLAQAHRVRRAMP